METDTTTYIYSPTCAAFIEKQTRKTNKSSFRQTLQRASSKNRIIHNRHHWVTSEAKLITGAPCPSPLYLFPLLLLVFDLSWWHWCTPGLKHLQDLDLHAQYKHHTKQLVYRIILFILQTYKWFGRKFFYIYVSYKLNTTADRLIVIAHLLPFWKARGFNIRGAVIISITQPYQWCLHHIHIIPRPVTVRPLETTYSITIFPFHSLSHRNISSLVKLWYCWPFNNIIQETHSYCLTWSNA